MKLFYREKGEGEPLIILHGLWGASDNWLSVAAFLSGRFRVILPDLRNHGQSPHAAGMDYEAMSDDLIAFIQDLDLPSPPDIAGHSMGGKALMALLMKAPERVRRAAVIDIAPVDYFFAGDEEHARVMDFMISFNLATYSTREALTKAIRERVPLEEERQLLLKNIRRTADGFKWKVNCPAIVADFDRIRGWPEHFRQAEYEREILFVKGEYSGLITDPALIRRQFPKAHLEEIAACGHRIHSEQPEKLAAVITRFFTAMV